jgi:hypothetical protein
MTIKQFLTTLLIVVATSHSAEATSAGSGYVQDVFGTNTGAVLFSLVDENGVLLTRTNLPSCATTQPGRWAIDATAPGGQAAADFLYKLWSTHAQIGGIVGTGTCTVWVDTETVVWFGPSH